MAGQVARLFQEVAFLKLDKPHMKWRKGGSSEKFPGVRVVKDIKNYPVAFLRRKNGLGKPFGNCRVLLMLPPATVYAPGSYGYRSQTPDCWLTATYCYCSRSVVLDSVMSSRLAISGST